MSLLVVKVKFTSDKNCFVALSSSCFTEKSNDVSYFHFHKTL